MLTYHDVMKGREYIKKHGSLRMKCDKCGIVYHCSGHCLRDYNFRRGDPLPRGEKGFCLCKDCDGEARPRPSKWFTRCQKDFPEGWILLNGRKTLLQEK